MKRSGIALTAVFLGAVACQSVQQVKDPAAFLANPEHPDVVLIVFHDGSELPIQDPKMKGDTVVGTWAGLGEPVSAPLSQVKRVDAVQKDPKRTVGMIAGVAAGTAVMAYGFSRVWVNTGTICSWDRGVDDRGDPTDLSEERCFRTN